MLCKVWWIDNFEKTVYNLARIKGDKMERKVALITGSSRGLGACISLKMAECGYDIVINYLHSHDKAVKLAEKIEKLYGVSTLVVKADVALEDDVKAMVDEVIRSFGKIDVLVNNASIANDSILEDKTSDSFRRVLDVNLLGTFLMCKYVSEYMLQNKRGKIINISSTNAMDTYYPYSMDYDASKAGVNSLTHNFAVLLAPYVNVNAIAAGWIHTDMNQNLDEEFILDENKKILLGRFAEVDEIANVVKFLASDEASYVNNSIIRVDGGSYHG